MSDVIWRHDPVYAAIGDEVLRIHAPLESLEAPKSQAAPPPPQDFSAVVLILDDIRFEVAQLRKDLASRTLAARLRRLWAWIRSRY